MPSRSIERLLVAKTNYMPDIQLILSTNGYSNAIVTPLGKNQYRILIKGEVYIGRIKELFNVIKWSYVDGKAEFYIEGIV